MRDFVDSAVDFLTNFWNDKSSSDKMPLYDIFSPSLIINSPIGKTVGRGRLSEINEQWFGAFPDLKVEEIQFEKYGSAVHTTWRSVATHLLPFKGHQPTGKRVSYLGETIFFFTQGKIVRYSCTIDMDSLYSQLGMRLAPTEYDGQGTIFQDHALLTKRIQAAMSKNLTRREVEILALSLMGFNARQVASFCNISPRTVQTHLHRALHEVGCTTKHQCLEKALIEWTLPLFQDLAKLLLLKNEAAKKCISLR